MCVDHSTILHSRTCNSLGQLGNRLQVWRVGVGGQASEVGRGAICLKTISASR